MKKPFLISVGGLARSGKNSFCNLLQEELGQRFNLNSAQVSLAWRLRKDLEELGKQQGFDVWTQNVEEKEKIRPLLLWYGDYKRKQTNGRYFIDSLDKSIKELSSAHSIFLLSDLRFSQFPYDEINYCQENGVVVHVSKYTLPDPDNPYIKWFDRPPNKLEEQNDPLIKEGASYIIQWEDMRGDIQKLKPYVDQFLDWLEGEKLLPVK